MSYMSEFSPEVEAVLIKDGKDWSDEERNMILAIMQRANRTRLKQVREQLRETQTAE
jgi:hypothetical protein